jgi:hypothetical protein
VLQLDRLDALDGIGLLVVGGGGGGVVRHAGILVWQVVGR